MLDNIRMKFLAASICFRLKQMETLETPYIGEENSWRKKASTIKALCIEVFFISLERFCFYLRWVLERGPIFYQDFRGRKLCCFSCIRGALEILVFSPLFWKALLTIKGFELSVHLIARTALTLVFPEILKCGYSSEDKEKKALVPLFLRENKVFSEFFPASDWLRPSLGNKLQKQVEVDGRPSTEDRKFYFVLRITKKMEGRLASCTNPFQKIKVVFWKNVLCALVGFPAFLTDFLSSVEALFDRNVPFKKAVEVCFKHFLTLVLIPFFTLYLMFKETKILFSAPGSSQFRGLGKMKPYLRGKLLKRNGLY